MFLLSWPVVLAMAMHTLFNLVDIFWVGKVGPSAIAAVSLAGVVFFIVLAIGQTLGGGTIALIARAYGAKQYGKVEHLLGQSVLLSAILAIGFGLVGVTFAHSIMRVLGAEREVLDMGTQYLRIMSIGFGFQLLVFSINFAFRGAGDMKTPMMIMLVSTILNMVLDPFMILGIGPFPRMEVQGAAYATVIAKFIGLIFGLLVLLRGKSGLKFRVKEAWPLDGKVVGSLLAIGVPLGVSYGLMALSGLAVFRLVARFGSQAIAALGIGIRVLQIAALPVVGIGIATTTLVGQNLGAKKKRRVEKAAFQSMGVCSVIMIVFGAVFFFNARSLVGIFTQHTDVIQMGMEYIRIASLYLFFIGLTVSMTGAFRGSGYTLPPMYAGLIKLGVLVGLGYYLSEAVGMGVTGIWWAMVVAYGTESAILGAWFSKGTWKVKRIAILEQKERVIA
jgi:putative MATE family efflux protein